MYEKRWARIKERLEESGREAFIIKQEGNLRYVCCSHIPSFPPVSHVVIPKKGTPVAIAPSLELLRARAQVFIKKVFSFCEYPGVISDGRKAEELLAKNLKARKIKNVLADARVRIKGVGVKQDSFVLKLRERKNRLEIKNLERACALAKKGAKIIEELVEEGKTELQVANELDFKLRSLGAQGLAFPTIIASGRNSSFSHHNPTNKKIKFGEPVICDFGARYKGYCSDCTRTVFVGNPNKEYLKVYELVSEAQARAIKLIKPGVKFRDIDLSIRNFFKDYRYDKYFVHSAGHGIGLEVHEEPRVACTNKSKIEVGNVFTLEPGLYMPKKFGVRIEDVVVVERRGARVLTR